MLRTFDRRRDDAGADALREQELNDALSYLDRAISRFASQEAPSRWVASRPRRRTFLTPQLSSVIQQCVAAFRLERRPGAHL